MRWMRHHRRRKKTFLPPCLGLSLFPKNTSVRTHSVFSPKSNGFLKVVFTSAATYLFVIWTSFCPLHQLQLFPNLNRTSSTISDMIDNCLTRRSLTQTSLARRKVSSTPRLLEVCSMEYKKGRILSNDKMTTRNKTATHDQCNACMPILESPSDVPCSSRRDRHPSGCTCGGSSGRTMRMG